MCSSACAWAGSDGFSKPLERPSQGFKPFTSSEIKATTYQVSVMHGLSSGPWCVHFVEKALSPKTSTGSLELSQGVVSWCITFCCHQGSTPLHQRKMKSVTGVPSPSVKVLLVTLACVRHLISFLSSSFLRESLV